MDTRQAVEFLYKVVANMNANWATHLEVRKAIDILDKAVHKKEEEYR